MKKLEEIYSLEKLTDSKREAYEKIIRILGKLEALLGNISFEDAEKLENEDYKKYYRLQTFLVKAIVRAVKEEEKPFEFKELEAICGNDDFWEEIKQSVSKETELFLKMKILRKLDFSVRKKCYLNIYSIIYDDCEDIEFACKKLQMDKEVVTLFFRVMNLCESCIISRFYSRRRVSALLSDSYGLAEQDAALLWKLFKDNAAKLEKIAFSNRLANIEYKLAKLGSQINDMEEEVGYISQILISFDEAEEE